MQYSAEVKEQGRVVGSIPREWWYFWRKFHYFDYLFVAPKRI